MVKSVTTIPARINKKTATPIDSPRKRRVAAYARVSTDSEEQATSYEAQVDYYTNYIKSRNDWEFVRVYADEGITGTNTKDRVEFKAMINDALDGKIDLIITKSVSRFARNTVDTLTTGRKLKEKNIEVWFEKENIQTLDSKGELLITIMSSLAQEESRSISENCTVNTAAVCAEPIRNGGVFSNETLPASSLASALGTDYTVNIDMPKLTAIDVFKPELSSVNTSKIQIPLTGVSHIPLAQNADIKLPAYSAEVSFK